MDLLQEISNRLRAKTGQLWSRVYDVAYDATVGLAKLYQQKTLQLVKITAATVYLQILKVARKHVVLIFTAIFAVVLLAVTAVVVPVALIMVAPWTPGVKAALIATLGLIYGGTILVCLNIVFSEEKWMKASGFQELLDSIQTGGGE